MAQLVPGDTGAGAGDLPWTLSMSCWTPCHVTPSWGSRAQPRARSYLLLPSACASIRHKTLCAANFSPEHFYASINFWFVERGEARRRLAAWLVAALHCTDLFNFDIDILNILAMKIFESQFRVLKRTCLQFIILTT